MATSDDTKGSIALDGYWVSPITKKQTILLRLSVIPWAIGVILFLAWWFRPEHHISVVGSLAGTIVILFEILAPAYFYVFLSRIKVVNPNIQPDNDWKLAMVVTRAPSEPWEVVQKTLLAMINQDVKHDTWLADEQPTQEIVDWCREHDVFISTRFGVAEYHRSTWPRRTRCKEGNLAYFYDKYGYDRYDIVAQLDADHVPEPGYLGEIIKPFVDPLVGYVAAPSICDANAAESWAARGRLYAEATLHGPLQCGYNEKWAPLCIGSHYCVRTRALKEIGGLGPELAEDHSTTLMMNAYGWKGVFHPYAIAHGDGPSTFTDCMVQEFQWARSLMVILLRYTPNYLPKLSNRQRFQFLFSQTWYTLFSSIAIFGYAIPVACIAIDNPLLRMTYLDFIVFSTLLSMLNLFPVILIKRYGLLRPHDAKIISWEYVLFTLSRFPWVFAGILNGITSTVLERTLDFRVTPKGNDAKPPLLTRTLTPYLIISMASAAAVLLLSNRQYAAGYYFLALISAAWMWLAASAITFLHYREGGTPRITKIAKSSFWLSINALLIIVAAFIRLPHSLDAVLGRYTESIVATLADDSGQGILSGSKTIEGGVRVSKKFKDCKPLPCFGYHDHTGSLTRHKVPADIVLSFIPWGPSYHKDIAEFVEHAQSHNTIPIITLEFWPWSVIPLEPRNTYNAREQTANRALLQDIVDGDYDEVILSSLEVAAQASPASVIIRPLHEMEVTKEYPWYSEDSQLFIRAFRHIVDLSRSHSFDNLEWMWSPAGFQRASAYWPGADFVDYIGLSIYATPEWNAGLSPEGTNTSLDKLLKLRYWVKQYGKPIILAEVGVNDTPQAKIEWLEQAFADLPYFPEVVGWVYFNQRQPPVITLDFGLPDWALSDDEALQLKGITQGLQAE